MSDSKQAPVYFEGGQPILRVENMEASVRFYVDLLGFKNANWGNDEFTSVNRDRVGIYLCRGGQGAWASMDLDRSRRRREIARRL